MAIAAADVALFTNDLRCLPHVVRLGRLVRAKVAQNVALAVSTKVRHHMGIPFAASRWVQKIRDLVGKQQHAQKLMRLQACCGPGIAMQRLRCTSMLALRGPQTLRTA